ncbi:aminoacyl-tRNA hydrolase [Benzoatithermus flavus]|uniref:Peptidyl-tRNA hydrolase n=1 Tax=Benzoatithermus flavus TaxID=3108223 RepID=A0ABU8XT10_9PROT
MKLFVGLGNPGERYARQRHNVGFMAVERIASRHGFGPWRTRFQGQLAEGLLDGERVLLLKPQTFMNESGRSIAEAARFHKLPLADIVVFHDELDLAPGKVRVKLGGGTAGHNGLRSTDACLGSKDFKRVRIGIGHPGHKDRVIGHVLSDFHKVEQTWLEPLLDAIADAAPLLARGDDAAFMNRVALLTQPSRPERSLRSPSGDPAAR